MFTPSRITRVRQLAALLTTAALAALVACSGSNGCGSNCTVPGFFAATTAPTTIAAAVPTTVATTVATTGPGGVPTTVPTTVATTVPTIIPTTVPTIVPTAVPSVVPTPIVTALSCAVNGATAQGVPLGTARTFAVLAGSTVTSSGPTVVTGDLGVWAGSAVTGFGPGTVVGGSIHAGDATAQTAQGDLTIAYNSAAGKATTGAIPADIGGMTIPPGVWTAPVSLAITGAVTLDGQNNPNAVFVMQSASTLTVNVISSVLLIRMANPCNVFWQTGSSATINTGASVQGTILSLASVSLGTGATLLGRALARTGAVTLLSNTVTNTP